MYRVYSMLGGMPRAKKPKKYEEIERPQEIDTASFEPVIYPVPTDILEAIKRTAVTGKALRFSVYGADWQGFQNQCWKKMRKLDFTLTTMAVKPRGRPGGGRVRTGRFDVIVYADFGYVLRLKPCDDDDY